ncbi:MAG: transglutaminase-like domain-containing protein [Candidatus Thorarchaeota archaeon]|jgi:transglutaminase-like putative cysteine protease
MTLPQWRNIAISHTSVKWSSGNFENLRLFLKSPPSDLRQKVEFIGTNFPFKINKERWSTIFDVGIPRESFDASDNQVRVNIAMNIDFAKKNPYRRCQGYKLSELDDVWAETPSLEPEYLGTSEFVETESDEIRKRADSIVDRTQDFWKAVRTIADWVNTYIVYSFELQDLNYRGALETLRTRQGTCSDFVHLFLALARALRIPSRAIIGLQWQPRRRTWTTHSWAEVFDPQYGWTPMDLVAQPVNLNLGPNYIRISASYNCAVRFYAYYTTPESETDRPRFKINQHYLFGNQSVQIRFFDE